MEPASAGGTAFSAKPRGSMERVEPLRSQLQPGDTLLLGTDMVKAIREDVLEKIIAGVPVKRLGTPEEIASIVSWLAGPDGSFSTGADFSLNGGIHM